MKNDGETLELYDNSNNLVDVIGCSEGWFAGDNSTKQTMERHSSDWQNSQSPGGTPGAQNSEPGTEEDIKSDSDSHSQNNSKNTETGQVYPAGIVINEILPSPTGPDDEEEWIEIFNQNSFKVNLSNWQITDVIGRTKTYTVASGTIIEAKSYLIFPCLLTKITLNNSGDGLILFNPNGETVDAVNYEKAPRGETYNKGKDNWYWSVELTPGTANIITGTDEENNLKEDKEKKEEIREEEKGLAAISGPFQDILPEKNLKKAH